MSLEQFNRLTNKEFVLQDNEFLFYINEDQSYVGGKEYNQDNAFPFPNEYQSYTLKEIIIEKNINLLTGIQDFTILTNEQLDRLIRRLEVFESNIHLINVVNWKSSSDIVNKLSKEFRNYNKATPPINDIRVEYASEEILFQIRSKAEDYNSNKSSNGILFYVTTILSVIFFFGSFILLYLNLFSDIEKEKEKFRKLNNIGITAKEIKQIISKEITTLFFLPTIIGTTIALLYIIAMATDIGGVMNNPQILLHFFIVAGIYHLIQIGFYLYAKRKMYLSLIQ